MSEVLIIGAGPTGLALAYELSRREIPFRIIDAAEGPSIHSKALGIQSRTLELLEKMQLLPLFLEKGFPVKKVAYHCSGAKLEYDLDLKAPYPFVLILPQAETEKIFLEALEKKNIHVEWKTRLLDIIENQAIIENPQGERSVDKSTWIVGCDGAHSQVRHSLKLPFKGVRFSEDFLLADVEAASSGDLTCPNIFLNKNGFGVIFPFGHGAYRLIFPLSKKLDKDPTEKELSLLLRQRGFTSSFEIKSTGWISKFNIHRRHCTKMRQENIFLAGDAAHIHSPVGGQGMNTSIQDAFNLAWKLSLVIKGVANDALLNSYEKERLPVAKQVLKKTTMATKIITFSQNWGPFLFYWALKFMLSSKKRREKMGNAISELSISYPSSPIIREIKRDELWKGPKAGQRAPDAHLADGKRLFELFMSQNHVLLLFESHTAFANAIKQEYGSWIDVHVIKGEEVRQKYAAGPNSLYLIRPDGYIGYRSRAFKTEEFIAYLLSLKRGG